MDINLLYQGGKEAIKSSPFKFETQKFEMNLLSETVKLYKDVIDGRYEVGECVRFTINERGTMRNIASNKIRDRALDHYLCDNFVNPAIEPYIIYDNSVSQKNKGVSFARKRFEGHLRRYFINNGGNDGYVLFTDFKKYYGSIPHDRCLESFGRIIKDPEIMHLVKHNFDSFPGEVGVEMGNQLSQSAGIFYPHKIDNYVKIVRGMKYYGRYADDCYLISRSKAELWDVLDGIKGIASKLGLAVNEKKTHIEKLSSYYKFLQIRYCLTDTGRVIKKINPKSVTRERRKLKAYRRLLDKGVMSYTDIENCYKSWMGSYYKVMSRRQIKNMKELYFELFRKEPRWKR